jgi:glutamyl-tRNA synthetase
MTARLRFAPSPTGYLHIGGVRTALFNWLWARKTQGTFILRIEDTDAERSTKESVQVIFDSLRWLGLDWDEGPEVGGPHGPYFQTQRLEIYKAHAEQLIERKKAFRCFCTKEELDKAREDLKKRDPKATFKYPGTCRDRKDAPDKPSVIRFRAPETGELTYKDMVFGEVTTPNSAQQDFVLIRQNGMPLYNFGAVVDDLTMGITIVARGRDHMVNTPPQILLYEAFGAKPPQFAHLPMMLAQSGEKLSKRHGAVSVFEYRDAGYTPAAVLNYLARFGWSHGDQEVFSLEQLVEAFDWEHCGRGDGKFDPKKFLAINQAHLKDPKLTNDEDFVSGTLPFLEKRGLTPSPEDVKRALHSIRDRATTFADAAERLDFFYRDPPVIDADAKKKFLAPAAAPHLAALAELFANAEPFGEVELEQRMGAYIAEKDLTMKDVAQPARVALTGRTASPSLFQVMVILGRDRTVARLRKGAEIAGT